MQDQEPGQAIAMTDAGTAPIEPVDREGQAPRVRAHPPKTHGNLVWAKLAFAAESITEAELELRAGVADAARSPLRAARRNGYRDRDWDWRGSEKLGGLLS